MANQNDNSASTLPQENQFKEYDLGNIGEVIQGACHQLGTATGLKQASEYLRKKAGELFTANKDELSRFCRELALSLDLEATSARKIYNTYSAERERAAFEELERRDKEGGAQ